MYSIFGARAERLEHARDQVAEAARLAGADIENAGHRRRSQQPAHHRDRIVDIDEIAPLLAVADAVAMRLEQPHGWPALASSNRLATRLIISPL